MTPPTCHPRRAYHAKGFCKECYQKQKIRLWNKNNPERKRELDRRWSKNNPERKKEIARCWSKNNPESRRRWRKNNPEKMRERARRWSKKYPEKIRVFCARRWLRKKGAPEVNLKELIKLVLLRRELKRREKIKTA